MKEITQDLGPFRFSREVEFDQTRDAHITDDEMEKIQSFSLVDLKREELAVFRMNLCNDQIDRHSSRFPAKELRTINEMIVGKPTLVNHDMSEPVVGRFFDSRLATVPTGPHSISVSKEALSVQPSTYMLRGAGNDDLIKHIEAGILSATSIGFAFEHPECSICSCDIRACAHWEGEDYDGEVCHYIMNGVTDVFEGSIVALGSQGTEIIEALTSEGVRVLPMREALIEARDAFPIEGDDVKESPSLETIRERRRSLRDADGNFI